MRKAERMGVVNEARVLKAFDHPNVTTYVDSTFNKETQCIHIVMEYCEGGDLGAVLRRNGDYLPQNVIVGIAFVARGNLQR